MVAFKDLLTKEQIWQIVVLIRQEEAEAKEHPRTIVDPDGNVIKSEKQTFKFEVVARNLETPWGIAFLPDGRMLITERPGRLRAFRNGVLDPTPIGPLPEILATGLGGLLDIALHPRFAENRLIYFTYYKPVAGTTTTRRRSNSGARASAHASAKVRGLRSINGSDARCKAEC